jgi:hypothetical protein
MSTGETPYTIALTHNEVVALVKYHAAQMRAVPKRFGKAILSAGGPVPGWSLKKANGEALALVKAHQHRAKELLQVIGQLPQKG